MELVKQFAVPALLLGIAWKFGKVPPKELAVIAAVAVAANMIAPRLPVVGGYVK